MTMIKICGITRADDAHTAIELGTNALGFVFFEKSKRAVTIDDIKWIKQLPPFVQLVGLFVNPDVGFVKAVTDTLPIEVLQFHGNESPSFCQQFPQRYIKAVPMQGLNQYQAAKYMQQYKESSAFLLDNYGVSEIGGSGTAFDHGEIPKNPPAPLIMAGGLNAGNVGAVIAQTCPFAVDVSSGVEVSAGIKSLEKMQDFIRAVRAASTTQPRG